MKTRDMVRAPCTGMILMSSIPASGGVAYRLLFSILVGVCYVLYIYIGRSWGAYLVHGTN